MNRKGLVAAASLLFATLVVVVSAITLTFTYRNEQAIQSLLLNGKTASAISAKKTAVLAEQIKTLVIDYQKQNELTQAQQLAGQKELPLLLVQIENNIAGQDRRSIRIAVTDATKGVEQYFASHPVKSVPATP